MKFKKSYLLVLSCLASTHANAFFTAVSITGTALKDIMSVQEEYVKAAAEMSATIQQSTMNMTSAVGSSLAETQKATMMSSMKASSDFTAVTMAETSLEINLNSELEGKKQMAATAPIHATDTKAEMDLIVEFLRRSDIKDQNMSDVIAYAESELDGKAKVIDKPILSDSSTPDSVGVERTVYPSVKIATWAKFCAESTKVALDQDEKTRSKAQTAVETAKTTQAIVDSTNSDEIAELRQNNQKIVSCTPTEFERGICGGDTSKEEYVESVLKNEIIPNGNLSASNFYSPQNYGGAGYLNADDPQQAADMNESSKDALAPVEDGGVKDLPEIVYTYRNSNQLNAAKSFSENIVNAFSVSNQPVDERVRPENAEFQAEFISRIASLNLAQGSFDSAMARRRGTVLSGISSNSVGETIKESQDGAGSLDRLAHDVKQSSMRFSAENMETVATSIGKTGTMEMLKELNITNRILLEDLLILEYQELIEATELANRVNSPENIQFMREASR